MVVGHEPWRTARYVATGSGLMLKAMLGLAALLGLSYLMADKDKIPEYTRQMNRVAWPFALVGVALVALMLLT